MRKIKTENLIAVVALVGICLLFGSFLFSNATGALAVLAAFVAGAGVIVIALLRYVKSRKVILGLAGVCIVCATVISLVTVPANAAFSFVETTMYRNLKVTATTTDNTNSNCEIDVSQIEAGKLTVIAKGYTGLNDCDEPEDKPDTVTITFTNISNLIMTYDLSLANTSGEAAGTGKSLEPGKSITIKVASGGSGPSKSTTGTIEFSNVNFEEQGLLMTTTFETRPGGTFTVDGEEIFENVGKEKSSKELYKLIATADPGYRFYGWMSKLTGTLTSSTEYDFDAVEGSPDTVWPVFVRENAPVFYVKDESPRIYYGDLNEAIKVAQNGSNKVVVPVKDETNNALPAGEYTIPTGVTLLIPFDDANTLYTNKPETDIAYTAPSIHLTLTMASGAHITVANGGAISLSAKQSAKMPYNGAPTGKLSRIDMKDGSSITVQGGGNLYCWGVITGSGSVVMNSGSTIYQDFQAIGWRGGSYTSEIKNNSQKVFPMNQYYFQNVQAPLTMESGAVMNCQTAMDITSVGVQTPAFTVVGKDSGLFRINSGSISFDYLEDLDRMHITIDGDVAMSNIVLEMKISILANVSINSANFVLPLMQNMDLTINGTADLMYDVAMLPGTRVEITESGKVNVKNGANLFVYDKDQWGGYCGSGDKTFMPSPWAYGRTKTFSDADLADSVLKVNGVLDASKGYVYTTTSGAAIISDGDGKIILQAGTQSVTYQISQASKSFPEIPITPAKLQNADGNYIQSVTNTYEYINGKWHVSGCDAVVKDRVTKQPTCAEPGIKATGCDCGLYDTGAQEIPKTDEHNYNAVVTAPTCIADGYTTHTCSVCGDSYKDSIVSATGVHTGGEATCTAKAVCTTCGQGYGSENPENHNWSNVLTYDGDQHWYACLNGCGEKNGVASHTYGEVSYDGDGKISYTATRSCSCGDTQIANASIDKTETAATCAAEGVRTYTATFAEAWATDKTTTESIEKLAHTEVTDAAVEATCTATGLTEGKHCSACNEVLVAQTEVPAKEHAGGTATCTAKAVCDTCGQEYGDVLAHDFENGTWVNPAADVHARKCKNCDAQSDAGLCSGGTATCTSKAVCDACGKTYGTTLPHDYKTEWSSDDNYHWYQCSCGDVKPGSQEAHVFIEQVEDEYKAQDATCIDPAVYYKSCECGAKSAIEIFYVGEKDSTNHVGGTETIAKVPATCMNEGAEAGEKCLGCEQIISGCEKIDKLEHEDANTDHYCEHGCGEKLSECTDNDYNHVCDADGCQATVGTHEAAEGTHICEYCGERASDCVDSDSDLYCDVCGANLCKHEVWSDATCTAPKTCTACGTTEGDVLGHDYVNHDAKAPACEAIGWDAYQTCSRCDYTTYSEIPATGHQNKTTTTVDATCTSDGSTTVTCNDCDKTVSTIVIPAKGHSLSKTDAVEETCTAGGNSEYYTCSDCEKYFGDTDGKNEIEKDSWVIPQKGHDWDDVVYTFAADGSVCTAERVCKHDGAHKETAEAEISSEVTAQPDCNIQENGVKTYTATFEQDWADTQTKNVEIPFEHVENPNKHGYCGVCDILLCQHNCEQEVIPAVAPTCDVDGKKEGAKCTECGVITTPQEVDPALGHDTTKYDAKAPTCEAIGWNAYEKCSRCDYTTYVEIPATGDHVYDNACDTNCNVCREVREVADHVYDNACDADCNECEDIREVGDHVYDNACDADCNECGEVREVADHVYDNACDADCNVCGEEREVSDHVYANDCDTTCDVCGDVREVEGHKYTNACDTTCDNCGEVREVADHVYDNACDADCNECGDVREVGDHVYATETEKVDATCTEDGYVIKACGCGATETTTLTALDHDYEGVVTTPPTCAAEGVMTYTCKNDASHTYTEAIAKLTTHTEETKEENRVEATCGADGSYDLVTYCSVCGTVIKTEKQTITATGDHVYATETEKVDATCTEDGYVIKACGCGATEKTTLDALDHDYEGVVTTPPTCAAEGVMTYTCKNDASHTYTEAIAKLTTHTEATKEENRVEATCGADGSYDLVTYCSVCGTVIKTEKQTITATGNHVDSDSNGSCDNCGAAVEVEEFTITFVDYFGNEVSTVTLKKGEEIPFPKDAESADSPSFELDFCGWAMAGDTTYVREATATQNATYTAMFKVKAFKPDSLQLSVEYGATGDVVLYATLFVYADTRGQLGAPVVLRDTDTVESEFEFVFDTQTIYMYKLAYTADDIANISSFIYIQIGPKDRLYEEKINQVLFKYAASLEHAGAVEGELSENVLKAQQALIDAILRYGGAVQDCFAGDDSDIRTYGRLAATAELWNSFDKEAGYDSVRGDNADSVFATNFLAATCDFNTEIALRYFYTAALNDAETAEIISVGVIVADSVQELESLTGEFVQSEGSTAQLYTGELTQITVNGQSVSCYVSTTAAMTINEMDDKYTVIYVEYADDQGTQYYYGDIIGYGIERFAQRQIRDYSSEDIGGNGKEVSSNQYNTEQYVNLLLRILRVNEAAKALEAEKAKGTN